MDITKTVLKLQEKFHTALGMEHVLSDDYYPSILYRNAQLFGREFVSKTFTPDMYSELIELTQKFVEYFEENTEESTALFLQKVPICNETGENLYIKGSLISNTVHQQHLTKKDYQVHFSYIMLCLNKAICHKCYYASATAESFYFPFHIILQDKTALKNYFAVYNPSVHKIEVRSADIQYFGDNDLLVENTEEVADKTMQEKIAESLFCLCKMIAFSNSKKGEAAKLKEQAEKDAKRKKLFANTDVEKRARAFYDLLKIPQTIQETVLQCINDEDDIFNTELIETEYMTSEEMAWCDKDELALIKSLLARYGLSSMYAAVTKQCPENVHPYNVMLNIGRETLKHGKTVFCAEKYAEPHFFLIDTCDKTKLEKMIPAFQKHGEFSDFVFFDEDGQTYPLPAGLFDLIFLDLTPHKFKNIQELKQFFMEDAENALDDTFDNFLNNTKIYGKEIYISYEDIHFTIKNETGVFSYLEFSYELYKKVSEISEQKNDVFIFADLEPNKFGGSQYILKMESQNAKKEIIKKQYTALLWHGISNDTKVFAIHEMSMLLESKSDVDGEEFLYELMEHFDDIDYNFFIYLDWKSPIEELDDYLAAVLKDQFPHIKAVVPTAKDYDEDDGVSTDGVLEDYSLALEKYGLHLGEVDTQGDDVLLLLHYEKDTGAVENALKEIGYDYA